MVDRAGLLTPRFGANVEALGNDQVLVTGGLGRTGAGISMIQVVDPLDTATKPAELYIHDPTDLCAGQGFCSAGSSVSGQGIIQNVGSNPFN